MIGQKKTPAKRFICCHKMIVLGNENGVNMKFGRVGGLQIVYYHSPTGTMSHPEMTWK